MASLVPFVDQGRTIRFAALDDALHLHQVINWAYRGKDLGVGKTWTGEGHLIIGDRITLVDLKALISSPKNGKDYYILALEDSKVGLVGCMKLELLANKSVEFGMFAIDPSHQSSGFGGFLFRFAMRFAKEQLGLTTGIMWVITVRDEILAWYGKLGFKDTGKREPFPPVEANCGVPRPEIIEKYGWLQFAVLEAQL